MRVGFPFVGDSIGGSHLSAIPIIKALPGNGVKSVVIVHKNGPLIDLLEQRGIETEVPPNVNLVTGGRIPEQIFRMFLAAPSLAAFLLRNRIKIVHTNDARMHFTWGLASRLAGSKFIWHQRSGDDSRRLAYYSRLANKILTISEFCRSVFPKPMRDRAEVIFDPISCTLGSEERSGAKRSLFNEFNMPSNAPIIGFVGNLTLQKRPQFFVEIAAAIRSQLGEAILFPMYGEKREDLVQSVQAIIDAHGLERQCRLMGPRYPIEPWIAACDVLVAPALSEGLGRTLVEAMLVGTPVVAADDAGHREVITDGSTGCLAKADDQKAFADAVITLLRDKDRCSAMCENARSFAIKTFSADVHISKIVNIYRNLLENS